MTLDIKELGPVPYKRESGNTAKTADSASKDKDAKSNEKSDCTVSQDNADFFVSATEKTVKLKKGDLVNIISWDMHQGMFAAKAKIDGKWVNGEIHYELIDCPDEK